MVPARKLAAIMFTDIAGFTAISAQDEEKALALIIKQRELLKPIVDSYDGRWLKEMGDGLLLSFSSSKEAVKCAIKIQQTTRDVRDLNLRIGIHQGDIMEQDGDIFGDDVNIAARIEPFAAVGGIALSNKVNNDIHGSPEITTKPISKARLKGVSQNIRIYCITSHGLAQTVLSDVRAKLEPKPLWVRVLTPLVPVLMVFSIYFLISEEKVPSVGILYMENLGTDEDEFWARGITEDVIIEVASAGMIRVSPMQEILEFIKSTSPLLKIAKKLKVKYLLTSSIYKHDGIIDLKTQLIEAKSGDTVFARKWSDSLSQASAITSVLAENILDELGIETKREIVKKYTISPEAYELYLRGKYQWHKRENQEDIEIALGLLRKAVELEPNLLHARLQLGISYREYGKNDEALEFLTQSLNQSIKLDDKLVQTSSLSNIGNLLFVQGEYADASDHYQQALKIALANGDRYHEASILLNIGSLHYYQGDLELALSYYEKSRETNTALKNLRGEGDAYFNIGSVYTELFDYNKAQEAYNKSYKIFHELDEQSQKLYPLIGTGLIASDLGDFDTALDVFEESVEIARSVHDERNEISSILYMADIFNHVGRLDEAHEYCQIALEKLESFDDPDNSYYAHQIAGETMIQTKDYKKAISHFKAACDLLNESNDPSYYLESLSYCALAELKAGKFDSVNNIIKKIENMMDKIDLDQESIVVLNWNLYQIFSEMSDNNKADKHLEAAYTAVHKLADQFTDPKQRNTFISGKTINHKIIDSYEQSNYRQS